MFFKLERNVTFKLASLLSDVNSLQQLIINNGVDISPFVAKISHAFLPSVVYQFEEYGLPRSIAKKIHLSRLINFEREDITLHDTISMFHSIGDKQFFSINSFDRFDKYVFEHFWDGITYG